MKIQVIDVTKSFKNIDVLSNVSAVFETGHIYGIYGRNGAGKSVFLKIISGYYVPTSGYVLYDDVDLNSQLKYPENLRALIEKPSFFPDLTGYENLQLLAKIQNKIGDSEILKALETVNLLEEKDKKYSKYSLGMKQKLGIAQAIMEDPEVIVLDEPFNGIEQKTVEQLLEYFMEMKKRGKIIIISTHIKEDLLRIADQILYFDAGKINERIENKDL